MKSFHNGKIEEGQIIHFIKDKFGPGKDEIWTAEWDDDLGKFYAYNQLNSCRDFEYDEKLDLIFSIDGIHKVIVKPEKNQ